MILALDITREDAYYFPVTLSRGQGHRFEVRLVRGRRGAAVNLAGAAMTCEIREEDDPESDLLSVAELEVIDDESGIYQQFWTEDTVLEFDPAAVFGYLFVFFSNADTNYERKILARGAVRVR